MARAEEESWSQALLSRKPPYFWWTLALIFAFCLAVLSWLLCLYVFNNPHLPENYARLKKFDRQPQIEAFEPIKAPKGTTSDPRTLYKKFYNLSSEQRHFLNETLIRHYLGNYADDDLNHYLQGDFRVLQARSLDDNDLFPEGIVIQAQSYLRHSEYQEPTPYLVVIELILPNAPARALDQIKQGSLLEITKNPHFAAVLHTELIDRSGDEPLVYLTAVPLVYTSPFAPPAGKPFPFSPPESLNLQAKLPILDAPF